MRHILHQNAEVGQQLPRTKAFVKEKLIQYGYCPQELAHSSLTATIQDSRPGKTILLRADMDALALQEQTGLPFQCNTGSMHNAGIVFNEDILSFGSAILAAGAMDWLEHHAQP